MEARADTSTVLILGRFLWADTTQAPQPGYGLAVSGGQVLATGPHAELRGRFSGAQVIEANDCVITPAFVNAHHHMYGVLAHGIPLDEAPSGFWPFLKDFWWPRVEDRLNLELIAAATDWACLEMVRSGVTTFYDCLEAPSALPAEAHTRPALVPHLSRGTPLRKRSPSMMIYSAVSEGKDTASPQRARSPSMMVYSAEAVTFDDDITFDDDKAAKPPLGLHRTLEVEAEVVRRWGLRGVLSFEATQRVSAENGELGLRENADFFDACQARDDLVSGLICFHTTFTCSEEFIRRAFALAAEREARVHMHLSEGTYEPQFCLEKYGQRPVDYYDHLGVLGPHVLASQCVQVDADEIDILARRGVHVSHQPLSNCEVGGGFAPVPEMLTADVNVALGTDGYINNFFEVMRAAALMPKARLLDPTVMPASVVWTMATQNGARALGFQDLGILSPGNQADLLLIRADLPTPLATHNAADQLLLWRNPIDLRGVMCAGRWLLWEGRVTATAGQDPKAVQERVAAAAARLWQT